MTGIKQSTAGMVGCRVVGAIGVDAPNDRVGDDAAVVSFEPEGRNVAVHGRCSRSDWALVRDAMLSSTTILANARRIVGICSPGS